MTKKTQKRLIELVACDQRRRQGWRVFLYVWLVLAVGGVCWNFAAVL